MQNYIFTGFFHYFLLIQHRIKGFKSTYHHGLSGLRKVILRIEYSIGVFIGKIHPLKLFSLILQSINILHYEKIPVDFRHNFNAPIHFG